MNASHRRPLFAYVLVTVAGAVVVAQGMFVAGFLPYFPGLKLDQRSQEIAQGSLLEESAVGPSDGAGNRFAPERLGFGEEFFDAAPTPTAPSSPASVSGLTVSAAPQPDTSGGIRSDLVGGGSSTSGSGSGGQPGGGGGDQGGDPVFGGPDTAPGDGNGGDGAEPGADPDQGPKPHDFDHGNNGNGANSGAHPYGPAQPPRGPGNNNGHGHGADKDEPGKPDKDKPGKPAKDKPGKAKGHDKPAKEKPGKGLAKGKGKVEPGSKGKKNS